MQLDESHSATWVGTLVRYLPNTLTALRILLVLPIGYLILHHEFAKVLWLVFIAGLSDGVDGWLARRFHACTPLGAIIDPLADKALLVTSFACLAIAGILPWWLALIVFGRDLLIIGGVFLYRQLTGRIDMEPSWLSKFNTLIQIAFILALITQQVWPLLPPTLLSAGTVLVAALAVATGLDYIRIGIQKTRLHRSAQRKP